MFLTPLILCDPLSLSLSQVVCQLGDLVCDCSVIYFPDKCGTMRVASVITSAVSIGGRVVCWPWTFPLQMLLFVCFFKIRVVGISGCSPG